MAREGKKPSVKGAVEMASMMDAKGRNRISSIFLVGAIIIYISRAAKVWKRTNRSILNALL
jgi:hypothetical protein